MNAEEIGASLTFIREAERLKNVQRSAHTSTGKQESTAEHTWRLCLLAMVFESEFAGIDFGKLLKICVVHDLGEAISGDIPAVEQVNRPNKSVQERADLVTLLTPLPDTLHAEFLALWDEYETAASPESASGGTDFASTKAMPTGPSNICSKAFTQAPSLVHPPSASTRQAPLSAAGSPAFSVMGSVI